MIECPGAADLDAIFRDINPDEIIRNLSWQCDWFQYHLHPACSHKFGKHIESTTTIFDMTNGSIRKMMSRQSLRLLQMGSKIAQDYYPETMGAVYVVNAPMLFAALYAIVKGFLDERTRSKIRIHSSNWQPVLLEAIDAENLPTFLGGTCTCAHVEGGCLYSKAGPWNDYVFVGNSRQLRLKSEVEAESAQ